MFSDYFSENIDGLSVFFKIDKNQSIGIVNKERIFTKKIHTKIAVIIKMRVQIYRENRSCSKIMAHKAESRCGILMRSPYCSACTARVKDKAIGSYVCFNREQNTIRMKHERNGKKILGEKTCLLKR